MPTIKQYNLQVFFIPKENNIDELERFIAKNKEMLKLYLLIVEDLSPRLKECLEQSGLDYIKPQNQHFCKHITDKNLTPITKDSNKNANDLAQKKADLSNATNPTNTANSKIPNATNLTNHMQTKIFTELIRSGREISNEGDIVIFNRVNSGAHIKSNKSVFVFGKCDGNIDCRGDFMVLSKIAKGKVLFKGLAITPSMLKYKLNLITKDHIGLKIDDVLSL